MLRGFAKVLFVFIVVGHVPLCGAITQSAYVELPCTIPGTIREQAIIEFKGLAYFCSERAGFGKELHVSNGGEFGTTIVKDLDPGPGSSSPFGLFVYKNALFFFAETTATGYALWKTDGTSEGTTLVKSLPISISSAAFFNTATVGETRQGVFFQIANQLFRTNGTRSGTMLVDVSVTRGARSSGNIRNATTYIVLNDQLYFLTDSILFRLETSGRATQLANLPFHYESAGSGIYSRLGIFNGGFLLFADAPDNQFCFCIDQLWFSDGTAGGTRLLRSEEVIYPLGIIDSKLFFLDSQASALYSTTDGVSDTLIKNADFPGTRTVKYNSSLIFGDTQFGAWITDGTSEGTVQLPFSVPVGGARVNGIAYARTFRNRLIGDVWSSSPGSTSALWGSDGTVAGSVELTKDDSRLVRVTSAGAFYMRNKQELWITDGLTAGKKLKNVGLQLSSASFIEGHRLYAPTRLTYGDFFWHSDGTSAGTYLLKYRFEDGRPPFSGNGRLSINPAIDLLLEDE